MWFRPGGWVRIIRIGIRRDTVSREKPDRDGIGGPFHSVDSSTDLVEPSAVGGRVGVLIEAALVGILTGGVDVAVCSEQLGGEAGCLFDSAAFHGVDGEDVGCLAVDALDDVDFAILGPVGANGPAGRSISIGQGKIGELWVVIQCRPSTADTARHMGSVKHDQTTLVGLLGFNADGGAALVACYAGGVNAHEDGAIVARCELLFLGGGAVKIVGEATVGIRAL